MLGGRNAEAPLFRAFRVSVWALGFWVRAEELGFRVCGLGLELQRLGGGLWLGVQGLGFGVAIVYRNESERQPFIWPVNQGKSIKSYHFRSLSPQIALGKIVVYFFVKYLS